MPRNTRITKIYLTQNNYLDYKYKIYDNKNILCGKLLNEAKTTKNKIVVSSTWNSLAKDLFKSLIIQQFNSETYDLENPKTLLMIEKNGLSYFNPNDLSLTIVGETIYSYEKIEYQDIQDRLNKCIENYDGNEEDEETIRKIILLNHFTSRERLILENNDMFDIIKDKHGIKITQTKDMTDLKVEFQTDMNYYIRNVYKPDIFLYTPSIKTGISFNDKLEDIMNNNCYFDKQYSFGLSGSVCVREYIQMLFRIRNLNHKTIEMCLGGKYKTFHSPKQKEVVYDYMKYEIGLFNKNKKLPKETIVCNLSQIECNDNEYVDFRSINQTEYYNSTLIFNQLFFDYMLNKHGFKINENILFQNETAEEYSLENTIMYKSNLTRKERELRLFTITNIFNFTYNDFQQIKDLLDNEMKITNIQYRRFNKFNQLTNIKRYVPIVMYYFLNDTIRKMTNNLMDYIEDDFEDLEDEQEYKQKYRSEIELHKILTDKRFLNEITTYEDIWLNLIDKEKHYDTHNKSVYMSKWSIMNDLNKLKQREEIEEEDTNDYSNDIQKTNNIHIIQTILKFLKIDNLDREYIYVNESNTKKYGTKYIGLRNELLTNTIIIEDKEYSFVDYVECFIIPKLDKEILKSIKYTGNGKSLMIDNNTDYNVIMKIVKHYLNMINFTIDYNLSQHTHKTCLLTFKQDKTKSFIINNIDNYTPFKNKSYCECESFIENEKKVIVYKHDKDEDIVNYLTNHIEVYTNKIQDIKSRNNKPSGKYKLIKDIIYQDKVIVKCGDIYVKEEIQTYETIDTKTCYTTLLKTPTNKHTTHDNWKFSIGVNKEYNKNTEKLERYVKIDQLKEPIKNSEIELLKKSNTLKDFECEISVREKYFKTQMTELLCKINRHLPTIERRQDIIYKEIIRLNDKHKCIKIKDIKNFKETLFNQLEKSID